MIFVAVGTQKFQFNRLLRTLDELVTKGVVTEKIFAQIGHSDYIPQNYEFSDFLSQDEFMRNIEQCDLLITHSGVATIIAGLKYNKSVIVLPRLAKYEEHVDDHQVQIAESFSEQNFVLMCGEEQLLEDMIKKARTHKFSMYVSQRELMIKTIRNYLETLKKND